MNSQLTTDYDAIVIGAGFAGVSLIHYLREVGLSVQVFDRASDIGGTWAWNKYPGAATDSEGYYYCLSFSEEVLQEWRWSKRYPGWQETQQYLKFVSDKFNMWPHIQFNTEITSAEYIAKDNIWKITSEDGKSYTCRYFISGMGMISQPQMPTIAGTDSFNGPIFHSSRWPEGLEYAGKRVGIIGAGATTVQMLPVVAETAEQVTVFQRTPNFVMPAVQKEMTDDWEREIKENYPEILAKCRNHVFGMAFEGPSGRTVAESSPEEVRKVFEENWNGSFRWVFETFDDLLATPEANQAAADFIIEKMITAKVKDPELAELLTPRGYPLFAKRPPLEHGYYEAYNRDNVSLVDIKTREPIKEITPNGIRTSEREYEFDIIVFATGFKAYTGALEAMDIRGESGQILRDKWQDESKAIMGVATAGYPNFFMVTGPQAPFANLPTSIEQNAKWIAQCISKMKAEGKDVARPRQDAEDDWTAHTAEIHSQTMMAEGHKVNSWMMGANHADKKLRVLI